LDCTVKRTKKAVKGYAERYEYPSLKK